VIEDHEQDGDGSEAFDIGSKTSVTRRGSRFVAGGEKSLIKRERVQVSPSSSETDRETNHAQLWQWASGTAH
jgi:hypothetical protein